MNLFDGQFKSKPRISLSGSSKLKDKDNLIKEAFVERKKREAEKQQQYSATKIQAVFRSYKARKQLRNKFRIRFKQMFTQEEFSNIELKTLLSFFILFFDEKLDQDELVKFSQFVLKKKDSFIRLLFVAPNGMDYSLVKFLSIHLKLLNSSSASVSHSLSLRLVDFFTDTLNYTSLNYSLVDSEKKLCTLFNLLLRRGFVHHLITYSIAKLPDRAKIESQAPLAFSIANLLNRVFNNFYLEKKQNEEFLVVNKLCIEFFSKVGFGQVKCVLGKLCELNLELIRKKDSTTQIKNIFKLIEQLRWSLSEKTSNKAFIGFTHESYVYILYSVLKLLCPLVEKLNDEQFGVLVETLQLLVFKIVQLDLGFESKSLNDEETNEALNELRLITTSSSEAGGGSTTLMDMSDSLTELIDEIFKMLDSKSFSNRIKTMFELFANDASALSNTDQF